jgi:hypothetical protein
MLGVLNVTGALKKAPNGALETSKLPTGFEIISFTTENNLSANKLPRFKLVFNTFMPLLEPSL